MIPLEMWISRRKGKEESGEKHTLCLIRDRHKVPTDSDLPYASC